MLKRNWVIVAALGLVLTSAFAAWVAWSLAEYQKQHAEQLQGISSYEAETAEEYMRICRERSGISIAATLECLANSAQANRQTQAAEYDLTAQQEMAEWAYALLLVSLFGVVISVAGLVALFVSLSQTRTAIRDSREIGEAQVRAYLHCSSAKFTLTKSWIVASLVLENTGQSPASKISVDGTATIYDVGGMPGHSRVLAWRQSDASNASCQPIVAGGKMSAEVYFFGSQFTRNDPDDERGIAEFSDFNQVSFDLSVCWEDVFEGQHDFPIELEAFVGPGPDGPAKRRYAGKLEIRTGDVRLRTSSYD